MRVLVYCLMATLWTMVSAVSAEEMRLPFERGDVLPDIRLPVPETKEHAAYLGLAESDAGDTFLLSQVDAEVLLIQIFSMYCPHCQREAPNVNRLYENIRNDERLRDRLKIVGIGAGNSAFEVDYFRQSYTIPFPLFEDPEFNIHKQFNGVRIPYFAGVKKAGDGTGMRVVFSHLGGLGNVESFLESIVDQAGLK